MTLTDIFWMIFFPVLGLSVCMAPEILRVIDRRAEGRAG